MNKKRFPDLIPSEFSDTRDALHAYSGILGGWASSCRKPRKHWWHASLRPSLNGLTTGVIYSDNVQFQIDLDLEESQLRVRHHSGTPLSIALHGQVAAEPAEQVSQFLQAAGVSNELAKTATMTKAINRDAVFTNYSSEQADNLGRATSAVTAAFVAFRSGLREETSPIQFWPHHFDLAMLWLPGDKVPDQDPDDEENADKQMNFGFTFGDSSIPEPYFYITAYPSPDAFASLELPDGARWHREGFSGAVLTYKRLLDERDPSAYLLDLWQSLLKFGREQLVGGSH